MIKKFEKYLIPSEGIDFNHSLVKIKARECAASRSSKKAIAKACFEFVRDDIFHSGDYKMNPVTFKASEVLEHKTGYCYAKSHLLVALLRANDIPAGLCYQRLSENGPGTPFVFHGLVALYLEEFGWYRVDARGNKEGVDAQFNPPQEQLAFTHDLQGEYLLPGIWPEPLSEIKEVLTRYDDYKEALKNLPDIDALIE